MKNTQKTGIDINAAAAKIKLLLLDVDGVLTDGKLYFSNTGDEFKAFSTLDGHGIKALIKSGVQVGIITGRSSHIVEKRAADLGISILIQGREDKLNAFADIVSQSDFDAAHICYMGDDHPDLPVMQTVGLSFSPPNAHPDVQAIASAVTDRNGGEGAVREVTDLIMKAQGTY